MIKRRQLTLAVAVGSLVGSPHAFMPKILQSEVKRRTQRASLLAEAQAAAADIDAGGQVYA